MFGEKKSLYKVTILMDSDICVDYDTELRFLYEVVR